MFEITINDTVYQLNFGFGFRREIDPRVTQKNNDVQGKVTNLGIQQLIAGVMDGDPEDIVTAIEVGNKGFEPRITRKELEDYLENEDTDLDALIEKLLGFFERANCTKKALQRLQEFAKAEKAKREKANAES
jgi:predicted component of type VI protein secretion system